ncbi:class I adenylate-forming enzyme family protein [Paenibacillus apiarius]|uniref:Acyl--CoA ligase n=1 Tax=Paenibacillus apiarius TaxID=46240 RepID=A0ABT4DR06_9BACL|nr:class I adenylate-forming enzyme family protein [Paenibacillus apiarius]MCY9512517.1 acyl--CoA ligase [Paenibacillus apiarius]MCY9519788.1 acyl--CoA ligase [Paenibacillus apiarius]MCY9553105.1 acyl--CoA ligase [Paenibacillus apiarius]MCY9559327.1 acyl--CoA ligase [Paenibacillus apiarius]MCY9682686.1 acyl--CoA ligase [Paenibacillus apiarius]
MSIYKYIFDSNITFQENIAIKTNNIEVTYNELNTYIKNGSAFFQENNFLLGQRVLLLLPNCMEFIVAFFAVTNCGGAAVLSDIKLNDELVSIIKETNPNWVITDDNGLKKIKELNEKSEFLSSIDMSIITTKDFREVYQSSRSYTDKLINIDLPAMILYSSGSTGKPKGVINSHRSLIKAVDNYVKTVSLNFADKLVAVTPFYHSYAFGSCMLAGLYSGSCLLVMNTFHPKKLLEMIHNEQATVFHAVPYMYNILSEHLVERESCLSSLRLCISAGSPMTKSLAETFYQLSGKIIHQEYGSSETGTIAINLSEDINLNIQSVGRPLNKVNIRVVKTENEFIGNIQVRNTGKAIGYLSGELFSDEWYETGDLGFLSEDGYLYIKGRSKRLINISGLKVNPAEIEEIILAHPNVREVLVRGVSHPDYGEIVEAQVVRRDENLTAEELIKFCQKKIALYKVPKLVTWIDSLPKSDTGKFRYS